MALDFSGNAAAVVQHGPANATEGLTALTFATWIYPTSSATSFIAGRAASTFNSGYRNMVQFNDQSIRTLIDRDGTDLAVRSAASFITLNEWQFIAVSVNTAGADTDQKIWRGTRASGIAEPGSYQNQSTGSGTIPSDASGDLFIGNRGQLDFGYKGRIACFAIYPTALSEAAIRRLHFAPIRLWRTPGCVFVTDYHGLGEQPDYTDNQAQGTVSLATVAGHAPVPRFGGLMGTSAPVPAVATSPALEGYRWRNDDGSESAATWKDAQDTDIAVAPGTDARLRMILDNPTAGPVTIQAAEDGTEDWFDLDVEP